jgi:hypothetical protein
MLWGAMGVKAARKYVDEIDPLCLSLELNHLTKIKHVKREQIFSNDANCDE